MKSLYFLAPAALVFALFGCSTPTKSKNPTPEEKREAILEMKSDVLAEMYAAQPDLEAKVTEAPGYAVFSNANVNLIFASVGGGFGVVHNNSTSEETYMKMGEAGVGFGLGVKDFRAVFVFHTAEVMEKFVESGWAFGAEADAAAKAGDKGGEAGAEGTVGGMSIYQLTKNGIALQAAVKGTKYWKDEELN